MKKILAIIISGVLCAFTVKATINGFVASVTPGEGYNVPSTNILALQAVSFSPTTPSNYLYITINGALVYFTRATNGLYTLPKALLIPAGGSGIYGGPDGATILGALIAPSDAPLFVGVGSSLTNLAVAENTLTGVVQLSRTAVGTKVLFQSSTNLVDWCFDSSVMVLRGSDDTKWQFTVPVGSSQRFYRALVRRECAG